MNSGHSIFSYLLIFLEGDNGFYRITSHTGNLGLTCISETTLCALIGAGALNRANTVNCDLHSYPWFFVLPPYIAMRVF